MSRSLLLFIAFLALASLPAPAIDRPAPEPTQLAPGATPGAYVYTFKGKVVFTGEPAFPVKISIRARGSSGSEEKPVYEQVVADALPFEIRSELPPGSYQLRSDPEGGPNQAIYWGAIGPGFSISADGKMNVFTNPEGALEHVKRIEIVAPGWLEEVKEVRPTLRWKPAPGAVGYEVFWMESTSPDKRSGARGRGVSTTTELQFPGEVKPKARYEWSVVAHGQAPVVNGFYDRRAIIGRMNSYFFGPGGEPVFRAGPQIPTKGSRLGASIVPDINAGMLVINVNPDSPASRAGLLQHDRITSFDCVSVLDSSYESFVTFIRKTDAGREIAIEVIRDQNPVTLHATLEAIK